MNKTITDKKINVEKTCKYLDLKEFIMTRNDRFIVFRVFVVFVVCSLGLIFSILLRICVLVLRVVLIIVLHWFYLLLGLPSV